jgi:hypothetical protein
MTEKPAALRLADELETFFGDAVAAAELRRLHSVNEKLLQELRYIANAKPLAWDEEVRGQFQEWAQNRARAAIKAAKGEA